MSTWRWLISGVALSLLLFSAPGCSGTASEVADGGAPPAQDAGGQPGGDAGEPGPGAIDGGDLDGGPASDGGLPSSDAGPAPDAGFRHPDDPTRNALGLNVWFLKDWDNSLAFVDAMKHARPWQDAADWHNPVGGVDAFGWPTSDASTVVFSGTPAQSNGTYHLAFSGQADVSLMWVGGTVTGKTYDAATNTTRAEVTVAATGTAKLSWGLVFKNTKRTATSAVGSGFADARLYRPGYPADGSVTFTAPFLALFKDVSVVRLMDWNATNGNLTVRWADRRTPRHLALPASGYTTDAGTALSNDQQPVALEDQLALCNALRADCWLNIPVGADDDYLHQLALAVRYGTDGTTPYTSPQAAPVHPPLAADLRVYLEYANEIWNSAAGFACFRVLVDKVAALPAGHPVTVPTTTSMWTQVWRYPAWRLAVGSDAFRAVFGDQAMGTRVRPVLMTQAGNANATLSTALLWARDYGAAQSPAREVGSYFYGAGGSGYYSVNTEPSNHADLDGYFAPGNFPPTRLINSAGLDTLWSLNLGLTRVAYEGGPSLDSYTEAEARALNADPRMKDLVTTTHDAWSSQGGNLLVYYAAVGPARWEFTPEVTDAGTPKLSALAQLASRPRAAVALGAALPGTVVAADWRGKLMPREGSDYTVTVGGQTCVAGNPAGTWLALPGHVASATSASAVLKGTATAATTVSLWVNGVKQSTVTLAAGSALHDSTSGALQLPAGPVALRVQVESGALTLCSVEVR